MPEIFEAPPQPPKEIENDAWISLDKSDVEVLQAMVERHGLDDVVFSLGRLCEHRAWEIREHESWKSDVANNWEKCGHALENLASKTWF